MSDIGSREKKHILLVDILGYKALCENHSIDELLQIIGPTVTMSSQSGEGQVGGVRSYVYADTIVFIPTEQTHKTLHNLTHIAGLIFSMGHLVANNGGEYMPIRGAIGYGEVRVVEPSLKTQYVGASEPMIANNVMMILGKGLIDAFKAEQKLELMGVVVTENAINAVEPRMIEELVKKNWLIKYDCPMKVDRKSESKIVENKKVLLVNQLQGKLIDVFIAKMEERGRAKKGDIQKKYENTVGFLRHSAEIIKKTQTALESQ